MKTEQNASAAARDAHTPTPWLLDEGFIADTDGRTIADCHCMSDPTPEMSLEMDANAELIVRAVNSHAELVAALEKSLRTLLDCQEMLIQKGRRMAASHLDLTIEPVRRALAKAASKDRAAPPDEPDGWETTDDGFAIRNVR